MSSLRHHLSSPGPEPRVRQTRVDLVVGSATLLVTAGATAWFLELPTRFLLQVGAMYAVLAIVLLWAVDASWPGRGLGDANRITLGRAVLVLPVMGLVPHASQLTADGQWWIIGLATVALVLDGVDGWVARRSGATAFGARFDMELDAALLLALALLTWLTTTVGPWVVSIGMLRYVFVLAGWFWPALRAQLPPKRWRQTVCVVQGIGLLVCLAPIVPPALTTVSAATALTLLAQSFGADVWWLVRQPTGATSPSPR